MNSVASSRHTRTPSALLLGAAYYPEHADAVEVGPEAQLMADAGFNLVRMGEFAWIRMEPSDGRFDFSWLDQAVEELAARGIRSLLCTPTAAPPKWLTDKYEDVLQTMPDGRRRDFGRRRHYCVNSPSYHQLTRRVVTALAGHYRDNPHVIGFQLDNEFMAEQPHCYCATCTARFQDWLKAKFGTIEELNRRWGMVFWSQSYTSFAEIVLPRPGHNPSALLDLHRFFSDSFLHYAQLQIDEVKRAAPDKLVTHNVCSSGFLYQLDLYDLGRRLDVVSVDNYPVAWTLENEYGNPAGGPYRPAMASFALSLVRGTTHRPFWVTEAQTGRTFRPRGLIGPGMLNVWTHQEIAHGAKAVLFFPWRQFPFGIEHLLDAVLDYDGRPRRRYFEVRKIFQDFHRVAGDIAGACPRPEVALVRDFACDWALDDGHVHPEFRYLRQLFLYYEALFHNHVNVEAVQPAEDLSRYRLVVAPALLLVDESRAANLRRYVEQGGTLVLTTQSAQRNLDNVYHREPRPAYLSDLCGIEIEEQHALASGDAAGLAQTGGGVPSRRYACSLVTEVLNVTTAAPLAVYTDPWFAGTSAVTVNRFGRGTVYYVATVPEPEFLATFIRRVLDGCGITPNITSCSSPDVESVKSFNGDREFLHLINTSDEPQTATLQGDYRRLPDHTRVSGEVTLPAREGVILERA